MHVFTVGEITTYVRQYLETDPLLAGLWVNGEVSNLFRSANGHAYFTLKEGTAASMRCALFRTYGGAELLADGRSVSVHGRISFYEARGDLQFYVDMVQPTGLGALALELERLKGQLGSEGLFDSARKRPLPRFPRRIGVVTSEQGAVFHDICSVVAQRYPLAEVILCPAAVQGTQAAQEITDAIRSLNTLTRVDVLIVGRGGGTLEDLWAFNSEQVARAIFASHVPVVSAVGHETDVSIADLVSDLRAPTPSAAAAAVTPDGRALRMQLGGLAQRLEVAAAALVARRRQHTAGLFQRVQHRAPDLTARRRQTNELVQRAWRAFAAGAERLRSQTAILERQLTTLNPRSVLGRGYAIVLHDTSGTTVRSPADVQPHDIVTTTVADGAFAAQVLGDSGQR